MAVQEPFDLGQFLASFKNFMDKAVEQARVEESETLFLSKLRTHFGTDPMKSIFIIFRPSIAKTSFCPRASWTVLNDRPLVSLNTVRDSKR